MRLLVTGATGFLGSRIAALAVEQGHEVLALVRASSSYSRLAAVRDEMRFITLASRPGNLARALDETGHLDAVVHAAATYGRGAEPMSRIVGTNVLFGLELLEACGPRVRAFVNIGTALPATVSSYAGSKRQFSEWAVAEAEREGWPFADLAVEMMYGPGDLQDRLVADLILACLRGAERVPLTLGTQVRDLVFVDDVANAALIACSAGVADPARRRLRARIGSGIGITVRELAEAIRRETGAATALDFGALPFRAHEVMRSVADSSGADLLGWRPRVTLADGLHRTITWYHGMTTAGSTA